MDGSNTPVAELHSVGFVRQGTQILREISWRFGSGQHWAILGPNGSGKSTLAAILCAYEWPTTGRVTVLGETYGRVNLRDFRRRLGVFQPTQQSGLDRFHPRLTAHEVICTGSDGSLAAYRDFERDTVDRARDLFSRFLVTSGRAGFPPDRAFNKLSAGERRKVLLLRTLMSEPELIILDEPFESLDLPSRLELEELLSHAATRAALLLILHRLEELPPFTTHTLLLQEGRMLTAGSKRDCLTGRRLTELYGIDVAVEERRERYAWFPAEGRS